MRYKSPALAGLLIFSILGAFMNAHAAASDGDLKGRVLRARDAQPVANTPVQITETGAKTTTNTQGAYAFEDLKPGVYTVVVERLSIGDRCQRHRHRHPGYRDQQLHQCLSELAGEI